MRKQRRAAASRVTATASRATARKQKTRPARRAVPAAADRATASKMVAPKEPAPPPPPRKPAFYEALAIYETGVRALQRHDFQVGADSFRNVIQRYPEERELVERARLYFQVCERETARRPPPSPENSSDEVFAATVALNAGDHAKAFAHLGRALEATPESDHAHYIMAVALTDKGDSSSALQHLRRAIHLNPDNRSTALQDPDLSALRELSGFRDLLNDGDGDALARRRLRPRR